MFLQKQIFLACGVFFLFAKFKGCFTSQRIYLDSNHTALSPCMIF
jgi:hypothetical protein